MALATASPNATSTPKLGVEAERRHLALRSRWQIADTRKNGN